MTMARQIRTRLGYTAAKIVAFLAILGPGLITASADNDAPGIATYSMVGSTYGYAFLWIILWITVGEAVVQEMAARMATVTGKGLTDLIRERFGVRMTFLVMLGLVIANIGTTAAQLAGVAASAELFGLSRYLAVPIAAVGVWFIVTRGSYQRVERILLLLSLYAVAYVISAFAVRPPWGEVLQHAIVPTIRLEPDYLLAVLATVGTTITPWAAVYLQASVADKGVTTEQYKDTRLDVIVGATSGNVVSAFIIIACAATLFVHGVAVDSADKAAMALAPIAGPWAEILFGIGLLGASLLAASVLPLSTTYGVCETFGWERGLDHQRHEAPLFYGLYGAMLVIGSFLVLIPGMPLFPLMWLSQVANAVTLPLTLVLMLRLANDRSIMKNWSNGTFSNVMGMAIVVVITLATIALIFVA